MKTGDDAIFLLYGAFFCEREVHFLYFGSIFSGLKKPQTENGSFENNDGFYNNRRMKLLLPSK